jgi:hypothetical protein
MMNAQENEKEAVRTTIVGGRPPGSGRSNGTVPRGIEVLVKKASVDAEFREVLFEQRGRAASAIALELDPAEASMLEAIPREQLAQIVEQTVVPLEQRRVFLGRVAAAMLAALGVAVVGCSKETEQPTTGVRPDQPRPGQGQTSQVTQPEPMRLTTNGIQPDRPPLTTRGVQPDRPPGASTNPPPPPPTRGVQPDRPMPPAPTGIRPDRPPTDPTNPGPVTGIRPDLPSTNPPPPTKGLQPDRP